MHWTLIHQRRTTDRSTGPRQAALFSLIVLSLIAVSRPTAIGAELPSATGTPAAVDSPEVAALRATLAKVQATHQQSVMAEMAAGRVYEAADQQRIHYLLQQIKHGESKTPARSSPTITVPSGINIPNLHAAQPTTMPNPRYRELRQRVEALGQQRTELQSQVTAAHPKLVSLESLIFETRKQLDDTLEIIPWDPNSDDRQAAAIGPASGVNSGNRIAPTSSSDASEEAARKQEVLRTYQSLDATAGNLKAAWSKARQVERTDWNASLQAEVELTKSLIAEKQSLATAQANQAAEHANRRAAEMQLAAERASSTAEKASQSANEVQDKIAGLTAAKANAEQVAIAAQEAIAKARHEADQAIAAANEKYQAVLAARDLADAKHAEELQNARAETDAARNSALTADGAKNDAILSANRRVADLEAELREMAQSKPIVVWAKSPEVKPGKYPGTAPGANTPVAVTEQPASEVKQSAFEGAAPSLPTVTPVATVVDVTVPAVATDFANAAVVPSAALPLAAADGGVSPAIVPAIAADTTQPIQPPISAPTATAAAIQPDVDEAAKDAAARAAVSEVTPPTTTAPTAASNADLQNQANPQNNAASQLPPVIAISRVATDSTDSVWPEPVAKASEPTNSEDSTGRAANNSDDNVWPPRSETNSSTKADIIAASVPADLPAVPSEPVAATKSATAAGEKSSEREAKVKSVEKMAASQTSTVIAPPAVDESEGLFHVDPENWFSILLTTIGIGGFLAILFFMLRGEENATTTATESAEQLLNNAEDIPRILELPVLAEVQRKAA
ncbi:MAG: hypothetical protein SGJ20_09595 [Planctomycetota bacterium]|nr:hypothetical protein [Planctomycetota bacterium]